MSYNLSQLQRQMSRLESTKRNLATLIRIAHPHEHNSAYKADAKASLHQRRIQKWIQLDAALIQCRKQLLRIKQEKA